MFNHKKVSVIIPAFNEQESIPKVIKDIPKNIADQIIVVNNGSTDKTKEAAEGLGVQVMDEPRRGYGAACLKGLSGLNGSDIVVILDADYSDYPQQMEDLIGPIANNQADFVIGSRVLGKREQGALAPQSYWGNKLAAFLIKRLFNFKFTDMGPFRAIRADSLRSLKMEDKNFGWNVEMQIKALKQGLRIKEVPVDYRKRIGTSKISGTISGTVKAGSKIIFTIFKYLRYQ